MSSPRASPESTGSRTHWSRVDRPHTRGAARARRPRARVTSFPWFVLDGLNVDGLGALVAGLGVVRHLGALGKGAIAVGDDRRVMDEQVLRVVVGRDEAKALLVAEPLHGSSSH